MNLPVIRDPSSKWFVTKEEYELQVFPDFLSGMIHFYSILDNNFYRAENDHLR